MMKQVSKDNREKINVFNLTKIENLVFQGGGVKGLAYIGALQTLCDKKSNSHINLTHIKRVTGASAGAITSLFIAMGKNIDELSDLMKNLTIADLLDEGKNIKGYTIKSTVFKLLDIYRDNQDIGYIDLFLYFLCRYIENKVISFAAVKAKEKIVEFINNNWALTGILSLLKAIGDKIISVINYVKKDKIPSINELLTNLKEAGKNIATDTVELFVDWLVKFFKKDLAKVRATLLQGVSNKLCN